MRKWVFILSLIIVLLLPAPARGQEGLSLSSLEVDLWPEYDRPTVLVIHRLVLSPQVSLPAEVSLRIPVSVGEPNAVASRQLDGSLFNVDYQRQVSGPWAYIRFTATTAEVQLEYYDTSLEKDGSARHFTYLWPGDYAVTSMTIQVQQPLGATDMRISPSLSSGLVGSDGLTYFTQEIGAVPAGQTVEISIDYQKANDDLSAEGLQVQPSAPIPQGTSGGFDWLQLLPWGLGLLGALLIGGGIYWYWRSGQQRQETPSGRRRRSPAVLPPTETPVPSQADVGVYCHQCGNRAASGDRFCRSCGARLRTE